MLKGKTNFEDILEKGVILETCPSDDVEDDSLVSEIEYNEEVSNYKNLNVVGVFENEDLYEGSNEPFDVLSQQMENILADGSVKKKILRNGYAPSVTKGCIVKLNYNAYTEFNEIPFDCTYARKKPMQFKVDNGEVIPGLDIAVLSMKLNEKSQFLIQPQHAYGSFGCMGRIPPNATILFEIEIFEIIDAAAAEHYEHLPAEKKAEFPEVYKYCIAQCSKAKDLFEKNYRSAIREYNKAVSALENANIAEFDDQVKQQQLLYKLYSNLLICYTKIEEPKKGCIAFNKINDMAKGNNVQISAKVYYNNAKCLRMLGDFTLARKRLQRAYELAPRNPDILNEMKVNDQKEKLFKDKELKLSQAFVQSLKLDKADE